MAYIKMVYKYLVNTFYNKINKKEYDLQIWQYNIRYTNIIAIKDVKAVAEKSKENKEPLAMENIDKTEIAKVVKRSNAIDLSNKYN